MVLFPLDVQFCTWYLMNMTEMAENNGWKFNAAEIKEFGISAMTNSVDGLEAVISTAHGVQRYAGMIQVIMRDRRDLSTWKVVYCLDMDQARRVAYEFASCR